VQAVPTSTWVVADPTSGVREVEVGADGKMVWDRVTNPVADFIGRPSPAAPPWRNPIDPYDVNDDGLVTPLDVLLIINELNRIGRGPLLPPSGSQTPPPYVDVSGDNDVTPIDALLVINALNGNDTVVNGSRSTGGSSGSGTSGDPAGVAGEGEASWLSADRRVPAPRTARVSPVWAAPALPVASVLPVGGLSNLVRQQALEEALQLFAADVAQERRLADDLGTATLIP
jgi:hypothetical protein